MRMPINKWYRFVTPLFAIIFVVEIIMIVIGVLIGY